MHSKNEESQPRTLKKTFFLFGGGSGAGLIVFLLVGGAWQVSHFWWVASSVSISCGLLSLFLRQDFGKTLNALMDSLPWI